MATSAEKLSQILEIACTLSRDGKGNDEVMLELASRELLPKKLLPKPKEEKEVVVSMFASKQAEAAAITGKLKLELGGGSGKQGKYTLADIKKMLEGPKQKPTAISPSALQLANENGLSITGVVGSGHEGRIVLKDIQALLDSKQDKDTVEISITPQALKALESGGYSKNDLVGIPGSGKDGKLMLKDIESFLQDKQQESETEDNDSDDE